MPCIRKALGSNLVFGSQPFSEAPGVKPRRAPGSKEDSGVEPPARRARAAGPWAVRRAPAVRGCRAARRRSRRSRRPEAHARSRRRRPGAAGRQRGAGPTAESAPEASGRGPDRRPKRCTVARASGAEGSSRCCRGGSGAETRGCGDGIETADAPGRTDVAAGVEVCGTVEVWGGVVLEAARNAPDPVLHRPASCTGCRPATPS
jgi:hypothetical protein